MAANKNSTQVIQSLQYLISGLTQLQPSGSFVVGGVTYTTQEFVKLCQQIITALQAVPAAKAAYTKASQSSHALLTQYGPVVSGVKQVLRVEANKDTTTLAAYGLSPQKPKGPQSPEVKVEAAEKAKATRKARNTMGPKAKLKITGATVAPASPAQPLAPAVATTGSSTPVVTPGH